MISHGRSESKSLGLSPGGTRLIFREPACITALISLLLCIIFVCCSIHLKVEFHFHISKIFVTSNSFSSSSRIKLPLNQTDVGYLPSCLVTSVMLVTGVGESYGIILPNQASGSDQSQNRNLELTEINGVRSHSGKMVFRNHGNDSKSHSNIEMTLDVITISDDH